MKRIKSGLSLVIAVVMCLSLLPMTALAETDWDAEFVIENGVLLRYNGSGGHVVIPNNVTSIENQAFVNCILESLTIPDSVTNMGMPFYYCNVSTVTIGNGVTSIGEQAFSGCTGLTSLTIGNSVTTIGYEAFSFQENLTNVTIPNSVKSIGDKAFMGCTGLTSITIPNNVKSIGEYVFWGCTSLTSVTMGNGITSVEASAFSECKGLTSVTIPDSVTRIGERAFNECKGLTSVTIPDSVTSIGNDAFSYFVGGYGNKPLPNLTINCVAGSAAETYAKAQGIKYVSTGGTTPSPDPTPTTPPKTDNAPNLDNASGWAQPFVNEAYNNGLIPSSLQSEYKQATTRAEFCALAVTLYEKIKGATITDRKTFDDTTDINVEKAAAIGVVSGVGNNKFDPNAKLTREQAAVMLARLAEAIGKPFEKKAATFADNGKIATWAIVQVGQIQAAGIMSGTGNNMFSPQDPYTREQSITTINRLYDVLK